MKCSTDNPDTHAGALPLPPDLKELHSARAAGTAVDEQVFSKRVAGAVADIVKKQIACGLDIINDGEQGKSNFSRYARDRLSGFIEREVKASDHTSTIYARDLTEFSDYFNARTYHRGDNVKRFFQRRSNISAKNRCRRKSRISTAFRAEIRGGLSSRHRSRHHRALDEERLLSERRGVFGRHRRRHARRIQSDRRRRLLVANR
jgi:5-methyltetrahydropteroyltriglutamate--homocysteine methyltransferase